MVGLPLGDTECSGSVQLGQGTVVPEVVGFMPVKTFSVLLEAHQCHTPNTFGTVNMEHTVNLRLSWSEQ